jgi:hypothetical protein
MPSTVDRILERLRRFQIYALPHCNSTLIEHLRGTHRILAAWGSPEYLRLAGLCHSIYGTESFVRQPASLADRNYVQSVIGPEAERVAYLFCAHEKESLWENLPRDGGYSIRDRFLAEPVALAEKEIADLVTVTLANWLEQRPRALPEDQRVREREFAASRRFLPPVAYADFLAAYGIA